MMKNKPLAIQIWLFLGGTMAAILFLIMLVPITFQGLFTPEIYNSIENTQETLLSGDFSQLVEIPPPDTGQHQFPRTVLHFFVTDTGTVLSAGQLPPAFLAEVRANIAAQLGESQRYRADTDAGAIFYVIRRVQNSGNPGYLVSYMRNVFSDKLLLGFFRRLILITFFIFLITWLPSLWLARYLSRPMVALEAHVHKIAERDWSTPIHLDRRDEIGRLAASVDWMRSQLSSHENERRTFLQNISHELKTPVMVIRSYARSIHDGIFPKGDLYSSVEVIEQEAERLERRIRQFLYHTKLDGTVEQLCKEPFEMAELVEDIVDRMRWRRSELEWNLELAPVVVVGDREQWMVALENLVDNQIRFAAKYVSITLKRLEADVSIRLWNDGPPIDPTVRSNLFEPYRKGPNGEFGLGLSIVRRVAENHHATISADEEEGGVTFRLSIPS